MILRSHQVSLVTNQEQWLLIFYWSPRRLNFFVMSFTCPLFKVETALVLIPHGESMWNEKILFTGSVDVPLTRKGAEEAIEAGKRICNIPLDFVYNSALIRSQMTPVLALTQHRCKKVPIIMHNCSTQAEAWSQIYSDEAKRQSFPVIRAWQLNERMYFLFSWGSDLYFPSI